MGLNESLSKICPQENERMRKNPSSPATTSGGITITMNGASGVNLQTCGIVCSPSQAMLLAFISGLMLSCNSVLVKYLINIHPGQLVLYRTWIFASLSLSHSIFRKENLLGPLNYRTSIILRSIVTTTTVLLHYVTVQYLPVGEATVLVSSSPVFVTIAAKFCLKESFGIVQSVSLLIAIVGMILTTGLYQTFAGNPRVYTTEDVYGFSTALACVFFSTLMYILTRKLKCIHSSVLMFNMGCIGVVISAIATPLTGGFNLSCRGFQQLFIILLGFSNYLAIAAVIVAMKYAEAGPVSTMAASSDIFFSFVWQAVIFGDVPDGITIFGASLIGVSVILVGFNKRISDFFRAQVT